MRRTIRDDVYERHYAKIDIIRADIRISNKASMKTAFSCGFKEQYTDRRHVVINGNKFEDAVIYDLEADSMHDYLQKASD